MNTLSARGFALFAGISVMAVASADTGNLTYLGMATNKSLNVQIAYYGATSTYEAGPQNVSFGGQSFEAYCVDLAHGQNTSNPFKVQTKDASSFLPNGDRIAKLVNQYAGSVTNGNQGAALQLAIWDILVDNGDGIDQGNFRASAFTPQTKTLFDSYLNAPLTGVSNVATLYQPTAYAHWNGKDYNQALISPQAVPEPASMIALGIGAAALLRRRQVKKAR